MIGLTGGVGEMDPEEVFAGMIWDTMQEDPEQMANLPEGSRRDTMAEMIRKFPEIAASTLDQPVSLESLMRTKRAWLGFVLEGKYISRLVEEEVGGIFGAMAEMAEGMMALSLEQLDEILKDLPGFLAAQGITDEGVLLGNPKAGRLNADSMNRWRAGNFTIRDLMMSQPWAVINN